MKAILYEKKEKYVICKACARECKIPNNLFGFCGVRYNINNELLVANWGIFIAIALDPIEKKPFYHFYPGHSALSLGTTGCSWACKYCINWDISQRKQIIGIKLEPEEIVELAKKYKEYGIVTITFTYNEPSIYSEFIYEVSKLAKKEDFKITWVSNGYLTDEAIDFASKFLDAITIDLKGNANPDFAKKYILINDFEPVFHTIEEFHKKGIHIEITDLVVPKIGDKLEDARKLSKKIYDILGEVSNIHFLRFHPEYKLQHLPSTSIKTLEEHAKIAKEEGIKYVYLGNVPGHELENTYCPSCGKPVIKRYQFYVYEVNLNDDKCKFCGYKIFLKGKATESYLQYPIPLSINKPLIKRTLTNGSIKEEILQF